MASPVVGGAKEMTVDVERYKGDSIGDLLWEIEKKSYQNLFLRGLDLVQGNERMKVLHPLKDLTQL